MAVTAKFEADFTNFTDGVAKAEASLNQLQSSTATAEQSLKQMTSSAESAQTTLGNFLKNLDIDKVFTNPLGAAKDAALGLVDVLGPMGLLATGAAAGLALIGKEAFSLADGAAQAGAALNDMSAKTGLSVPTLSRYAEAAQVAGSDIGTLTNAVFQFQRGLGESTGSDKFAEGLSKIGLSFEQIKATSPDQYLQVLAQAFAATTDPATKAAAAYDLFGRQGRDLLPVLGDLQKGLEMTSDIEPWTAEQAAAAAQFEMQMRSIKVHVEAFATAVGSTLIPVFAPLGAALADGMHQLKEFADSTATDLNNIASAIDVLRGAVPGLTAVTGPATEGVKAWHTANQALALHVPTLAEALTTETRAIRDMKEETSQAEAFARKWGAAMAELDSVGGNFQTTLEGINGDVVEAVKYYLQAGVSQNTLATAYELTATQIKAVSAAMREEAEMHKTLAKIEDDHTTNQLAAIERIGKAQMEGSQKGFENMSKASDQIMKAERDLHDYQLQQTLDTTSYKITKIWEVVDEQEKAFKGDENQRASYNAAIEALASEQTNKLLETYGSGIDQMVDKGKAALAETAAAVQTMQGGIKLPGSTTETAFGQNYLVSPSGQRIQLGPHGELPDNWFQMYSGASNFSSGINPFGRGQDIFRAAGGPVSSGTPYIVGEKGPELFMPTGAGQIIPNNQISNVFHLVDTESNLAKRVADILMQQIRNGVKLASI